MLGVQCALLGLGLILWCPGVFGHHCCAPKEPDRLRDVEAGASPHLLGAPDICCQLCGEVELDQGLPRWH